MADEWVQLGDTVNGIHQSGFGFSVSTNLDGTKMVMGAPYANGDAGMVRVYEDIDGTWTQLGDDIIVTNEKYLGYSVTMDSTGTIIAISAPYFDSRRGRVRVYEYNVGTSQWEQKGAVIDGETAGTNDFTGDLFGSSLSMNSDGTILTIGAVGGESDQGTVGQVRAYEYKDVAGTFQWTQLGGVIFGTHNTGHFGYSVSMNSDGTRMAVGAIWEGGARGQAHVYEYKDVAGTFQWTQLGGDIDGENGADCSGSSVSMNSDGTILAIGAYGNDGNGNNSGHARVYEYNGTTWQQLGADIDGELAGDNSGYSVSMNSAGTILAIGAYGNANNMGCVRVYEYNVGTSQWTQLSAIYGLTSNERFGQAVSINSSGTRIVIGAPYNDGNGGVRVYAVPGGAAAGGAAGEITCDFVMDGLDSAFALSAAINFNDLTHTPATADALPHIDITVSTADRQDKLNKLFSVELPEGSHIGSIRRYFG